VTITCPPLACVVGFRVIDPAAAAMEAKASDAIKTAIINAMIYPVLFFILFSLFVIRIFYLFNFLNNNHSPIVSA
jgi:L-asparagine transporter-like permease